MQSAMLSVRSSEWGPPPPHQQARVALAAHSVESKGETHSFAGEGMGDPILTKGQVLYVYYTVINLRDLATKVNSNTHLSRV
jgi:hypothetical protein